MDQALERDTVKTKESTWTSKESAPGAGTLTEASLRLWVSVEGRRLRWATRRPGRRPGTPDAGLTTLEIVIWGLGLFLAATAAIAVITQAIDSRTQKIS